MQCSESQYDRSDDTVCGDRANLSQTAVHCDGPVITHDEYMTCRYVVWEGQIALADRGLGKIGFLQCGAVDIDLSVRFHGNLIATQTDGSAHQNLIVVIKGDDVTGGDFFRLTKDKDLTALQTGIHSLAVIAHDLKHVGEQVEQDDHRKQKERHASYYIGYGADPPTSNLLTLW